MATQKTLSHESKIYHELSTWYECLFERFFGPRARATIRSLDIPAGSRILEVGVGTGISLSAYPAHTDVTAIDLSAKMLSQAQEKVDQGGWSHIALQEMDALDLKFPDESFDYVMAFHIVSVVPDYEKLMSEMLRVCKPGGRLIIINHFRSPRPWIAIWVDLLDPLTRHFGWRTTLRLSDLIAGQPVEIQRDFKTSWRSVFRVVFARKSEQVQRHTLTAAARA